MLRYGVYNNWRKHVKKSQKQADPAPILDAGETGQWYCEVVMASETRLYCATLTDKATGILLAVGRPAPTYEKARRSIVQLVRAMATAVARARGDLPW